MTTNTETMCETIHRIVREELTAELSFVREEAVEAIADGVCNKIQSAIDEAIEANSIDSIEAAFRDASKEMWW